jgi:hypothetical protein
MKGFFFKYAHIIPHQCEIQVYLMLSKVKGLAGSRHVGKPLPFRRGLRGGSPMVGMEHRFNI